MKSKIINKRIVIFSCLILTSCTSLIAQIPSATTKFEKIIKEYSLDITSNPIRTCAILDSLYYIVSRKPTLIKDTAFKSLLYNSRMGACFNAIKPLSEIDQNPMPLIHHCLKIKNILFQQENDNAVLVQALLYLNSILALNYEKTFEYERALDLRNDFIQFKHIVDSNFKYEYSLFLTCLLTSFKEAHRVKEGIEVANYSLSYFFELLNKNYAIPIDLEKQIQLGIINTLNSIGELYYNQGNITFANNSFSLSVEKVFEWDLIDKANLYSQVVFLGHIKDFEGQWKLLERIEERIITKSSKNSDSYLACQTMKINILIELGDYLKAKDLLIGTKMIAKKMDAPFFILQGLNQQLIIVYDELNECESVNTLFQEIINAYRQYYGKSKNIVPILESQAFFRCQSYETKLATLKEAENLAIEYRDTVSLASIYNKIILIINPYYIEARYKYENNYTKIEAAIKNTLNLLINLLNTDVIQKSDKFEHLVNSAASEYILLNEYKKGLSIIQAFRSKFKNINNDEIISTDIYLAELFAENNEIDSSFYYCEKVSNNLKETLINKNFLLAETGHENYTETRYFGYIDKLIHKNTLLSKNMPSLIANNAIFRKSMYLNNISTKTRNMSIEEKRNYLIKNKEIISKQVKWEEIQKHLKKKCALVEFITYDNSAFDLFYAIIIKSNGNPVLVKYPYNDSLYTYLNNFKGQIDFVSDFYEYKESGGLYQLLWKPIENHIKEIDEVLISADGLLHAVNFSAIKLQDGSIIEEHKIIRRILSSRNLDKINKELPISHISLFGGIDYNQQNSSTFNQEEESSKTIILRNRNRENVTWGYLSGTKDECTLIQKISKKYEIKTNFFSGKEGTEEAFYQTSKLKNKFILHFASHGFSELNILGDNPKSFETDPLSRTGLVFAGANRKSGDKYEELNRNDGIAFGTEVAKQSFDNCELLVLSACETGLGLLKGKEGVFGLQRAFKISGVNKIIASLWQVPDKQTAEFFSIFYTILFENKSVSNAFHEAQLAMKNKYDPYFWAGFLLLE